MKNLLIVAAVTAVVLTGCMKDPLPKPTSQDAVTRSADTSVHVFGEAANCYIVTGAGEYSFPAVVLPGDIPPSFSSRHARLLWQTRESNTSMPLVTGVRLEGGYIRFTASDLKGNASVGLFEADSSLVWSWHIWLTDRPEEMSGPGGTVFMDRDLGATVARNVGVASHGLLYQWGRKDPFYGSTANDDANAFGQAKAKTDATAGFEWHIAKYAVGADITVRNAIKKPTGFITIKNFLVAGDWLTKPVDGLWAPVKTIYDPCPAGYRVPQAGEWWSDASSVDSLSRPDVTYAAGGTYLYYGGRTSFYPYSGVRLPTNAVVSAAGSNGYHWTCTPDGEGKSRYFINMRTGSSGIWSQSVSRASGMSVRCVKYNGPVVNVDTGDVHWGREAASGI